VSARSEAYAKGRIQGIRDAITWLHARADEMNDAHAKGVLNGAAFNLGMAKVEAMSSKPQLEGLEGSSGLPTHAFQPDEKYPWFCGRCGYSANERLKHTAPPAPQVEGAGR
jgi:hypothetical protein